VLPAATGQVTRGGRRETADPVRLDGTVRGARKEQQADRQQHSHAANGQREEDFLFQSRFLPGAERKRGLSLDGTCIYSSLAKYATSAADSARL
jgi:hypothetical protein